MTLVPRGKARPYRYGSEARISPAARQLPASEWLRFATFRIPSIALVSAQRGFCDLRAHEGEGLEWPIGCGLSATDAR